MRCFRLLLLWPVLTLLGAPDDDVVKLTGTFSLSVAFVESACYAIDRYHVI